MHYIEQIDNWAKEKLSASSIPYKFREVDRLSQSMGAYILFQNHHINLLIICDRGITDIEVGPKSLKKGKHYCISFFKDLIEPASRGRWNLSLDKQLEFIENQYEWFSENLSIKNAQGTLTKVEERCNETFNNGS